MGIALLIRAGTLPETTPEGDREGEAWRSLLEGLARPEGGPGETLDTVLPFLLAAGRQDLVARYASGAVAAGLVPGWLAAPAGGDGGEAAVLAALVATSSDTTGASSCADGGASAGGTF